MDKDLKENLEYILEINLKKITAKYASYVDCLRNAIEHKEDITPEILRAYLLSLSASSKDQELSLMSDKKSELKKCETIAEIFEFLTCECASFLNYEVFQNLLENFNISTDEEKLQYPKHLKDYAEKHKISEFYKINPLLKTRKWSKELTLKYDVDSTCRLAKVSNLKKSLAKVFRLLPMALEIVDIKKGCVVVTFLIPGSVADAIFTPDTVLTPEQEDQLRAESVKWLKCNGYTFYFGKGKLKEAEDSENPGIISIYIGPFLKPQFEPRRGPTTILNSRTVAIRSPYL